MTSIENQINNWVSSWNESDPAKREAAIETSWSPDGVYRNATSEFQGHDGIAQAVTAAYDAFVANGFIFTVANVDTNHDVVRYTWEMRRAEGGAPDSIGTHIAILGSDGRCLSDHQFIDKAPPAS
jgi:nuclear transport factor 2 (NTF2) superfamily protein